MLVTGKGISAGYTPIGACLVGQAVLTGKSATETAIGHTMNGSPLSAATALAVLRYLRENQLDQRARVIGGLLRERLTDVAGKFPFVSEPRGRGMLLGLPLRQEQAAFAGRPLARRISQAALGRGLLIYPAGVHARSQAILVAPPLTLREEEVGTLIERLSGALSDVAAEIEMGGDLP